MSAAHRHYVGEFPGLKCTTVCDWRKVISAQQQKEHKAVTELHGKKRGRPPTLPDEVVTYVMKYICAVRDAGGVINTAIVIGATSGIVKRLKPEFLECNGGYVVLPVKKDWAKYLLSKMKFVKRKTTTKKFAITVSNYDKITDNFLMDIKAVVVMEEAPDMILNWDQTAIRYIPVSNWTMSTEGSKRIELIGHDDKRQITATFVGTLTGQFLPI